MTRVKTGGASGAVAGCSTSATCCRSPVGLSFYRGASSAAAGPLSHHALATMLRAIEAEAAVAHQGKHRLPRPQPSSTTIHRAARVCNAARFPAATTRKKEAQDHAAHADRRAQNRRNKGTQPATIPTSRWRRRSLRNLRLRCTAQGALAVHWSSRRSQTAVRIDYRDVLIPVRCRHGPDFPWPQGRAAWLRSRAYLIALASERPATDGFTEPRYDSG